MDASTSTDQGDHAAAGASDGDAAKKKSLLKPRDVATAAASAVAAPITKTCGKKYYVHEVIIYYEDTDFSGVVYHPNYLKYFERAREHALGPKILVDLYDKYGFGFVVYSCEMNFKEGARFGDLLEIRTTIELSGQYRVKFDQQVFRAKPNASEIPLVKGRVEMVCVDKQNKLIPIPDVVLNELHKDQ